MSSSATDTLRNTLLQCTPPCFLRWNRSKTSRSTRPPPKEPGEKGKEEAANGEGHNNKTASDANRSAGKLHRQGRSNEIPLLVIFAWPRGPHFNFLFPSSSSFPSFILQIAFLFRCAFPFSQRMERKGEGEVKPSPPAGKPPTRHNSSDEGFVTQLFEVFENERFQPFRGWGSTYPGHLLPTDRSRFSDRSGSVKHAPVAVVNHQVVATSGFEEEKSGAGPRSGAGSVGGPARPPLLAWSQLEPIPVPDLPLPRG